MMEMEAVEVTCYPCESKMEYLPSVSTLTTRFFHCKNCDKMVALRKSYGGGEDEILSEGEKEEIKKVLAITEKK